MNEFDRNSGKRFAGRMEPFGLLLFDLEDREYSSVNLLAASILKGLDEGRLQEVIDYYSSILPDEDKAKLNETVNDFIETASTFGYIDENDCVDISWINESYNELKCRGALTAPTLVYLEVTYRCNLKCKHCGLTKISDFSDELSMKEIDDIFTQMENMGTMGVSILGGEPLARKDIFEILQSALSHNIGATLTTNTTMINKENVRKLEESKLLSLKISMEGVEGESYENIRGKGTYSRFLEGLHLLRESGINLSMGTTIMKPNLPYVRDIVEFAIKQGIGTIAFNLVKKWGDNTSLMLNYEEYREFVRLMAEEILPEYSDAISINLPPSFYPVPQEGIYLFDNFGCVAGNSVLHINPDGWVCPCNFIKSLPATDNIRERQLQDIWLNGEKFRKIRSIQAPKKCSTCRLYLPCRGGCRAQPSSIEEPDIYCLKDSNLF